ncbi:MAG: PAS domain-containing protein [Cypionkella sp.]
MDTQLGVMAIKTTEDVHFGAEVPYGIEELIYSRTDKRGVILAGNSVFQRVAGYDWPKLIGASHRLVRHPATPRAVFRILWAKIQKGEPAVAYICNKAEDGRFYWVLATVLPYANSYLSVHIKPTSGLFAKVQGIYAEVSAAEREGLPVEASVDLLLTAFRKAGFADYGAFMRQALAQEIAARSKIAPPCHSMSEVAVVRKTLVDVIANQEALVDDFERLRILPTNMRILASRLEPTGGPVGAISDIYLMISSDIFRKVAAFSRGEASLCQRMSERFEKAMFLMSCAQLQAEAIAFARTGELGNSGIDRAAEVEYLTQLSLCYREEALQALQEAVSLADTIHEASVELRRDMLSLETITVMGRVESARIGAAGMRIDATINQLHDGNMVIGRLLNLMNELAGTITKGMRGIEASYKEHSFSSAAPMSHP